MPKIELMKTDIEKAKEVDAYVLASYRLKTTTPEYEALKTLLEQGNLLYCFLGKFETLDLSKILIHFNFKYEFRCGGLEVTENHKLDFYHRIMYPPRIQPTQDYRSNYYGNNLSVGKEDRSTRNWAENVLSRKKGSI